MHPIPNIGGLLRSNHLLTEWPTFLQACHRLTKVEVDLGSESEQTTTERFNWIVAGVNKAVSRKLGIEGKSDETNEYTRRCKTTWMAEEGKFMDWSWKRGPWRDWEDSQDKWWLPGPWDLLNDPTGASLKFLGGAFVIRNYCWVEKRFEVDDPRRGVAFEGLSSYWSHG